MVGDCVYVRTSHYLTLYSHADNWLLKGRQGTSLLCTLLVPRETSGHVKFTFSTDTSHDSGRPNSRAGQSGRIIGSSYARRIEETHSCAGSWTNEIVGIVMQNRNFVRYLT